MISKAHISSQKPRGRQLNTKVCARGSENAILLLHNVQQQYLENGSSTHRHFITKLMLITARSYTTTQRLHSSNRAVHSTVSCPDPTLSRGKGSGDH